MRYFLLCLILVIAITNVFASSAPMVTGEYDERSLFLTYAGTWTTNDANTLAYQQTTTNTTDPSAVLTFNTQSTAFTLFFFYDGLGDSMDVCIDGVCTQVSTVGSVARGYVTFNSLDPVVKTITVSKVTADSSVISIDAVLIHPEVTTDIDNTITYNNISGSLILSMSAGELAIALLLSITIVVQLATYIIHVWGMKPS